MLRFILLASALVLTACSPAKPVVSETAPDPASKAQPASEGLPEAGKFDPLDVATGSWIAVSASQAINGSAPISICHVGPAINEDISLAVVVEKNGAKQVGVSRVPSGGRSRPLGDVELKVDSGASHSIRSTPMNAAAQVVWPPGTATLFGGPEADALISEIVKGAEVEVKESGASATRSFPTEGLANAIAKCVRDLK
jgi:hypothetical protein